MATAEDKSKIHDFVTHLFQNPSIKEEPILVAEGLIINFIIHNLEQLKPAMKNPQFFPHMEWNEILQLILMDLYDRAWSETSPVLEKFYKSTDFTSLQRIPKAPVLPADFIREKLKVFTPEVFKNKDARFNFNSVINIFQYGIIDKYIDAVFTRKGFLYNELVRVQKVNLEHADYIVFLKTLLLIKNASYMKLSLDTSNEDTKTSLFEILKSRSQPAKYFDTAAFKLSESLPFLPVKFLKVALKSCFKHNMTDNDETVSRFLYIMSARFHNYKHSVKVDRGAESPDKSWFGIAKKNAEYYGYDKRMLDDLYMIAGDNNW
jgi:hypothetical protein